MKNELPTNWIEVNFENIADATDFVANGSFKSLSDNVTQTKIPDYAILVRLSDYSKKWNGNFRYVTKSSYEFLSKSSLLPGDLFIANVGYPGKLFLMPDLGMPMTIGPNGLRIRSKIFSSNVFLSYYYRSPQGKKILNSIVSGTAQQKFNKTGLRKSSVLLPTFAEQQRIVVKLDELFGHLDVLKTRLKNIPQILKNFRQAVLTQAVTGKLTEEWRVGKELEDADLYLGRIYKSRVNYQIGVEKVYSDKGLNAPRKPSQSILDGSHIPISIPKLWKEVRLGDLIVDLTDYHANGSYVKLKANVTLKEEEDYACMIRSTNFEKNNFEDLLIYIDEKAYNFMHRSKLFGGEILISKIGNAGSVYLMPNLNRPASLAMNLFALRVNELVDNKFLYYYLISNSGSNLINKYVRGVATKSIDKISVRSVMVGLPSEEEQTEIVKRVEHLFAKADAIEAQYLSLKTKIDSLPQAILAKAFKGELVEQLDTDGDAKVLLEEIKKLKAEATKRPKKRVKPKPKRKKIIDISFESGVIDSSKISGKGFKVNVDAKYNSRLYNRVDTIVKSKLFIWLLDQPDNKTFEFDLLKAQVAMPYQVLSEQVIELLDLTSEGMRPGIKRVYENDKMTFQKII
ncbi:restriction endonuclease subunit S [Cellulophaga baltica]|uniref:restriction endonuclease subunit S n=1 Tax=Cellulophaga baltica TaxID=76594 RepID=UPI0024955B07|nr:restriction endonuclease subunit S [Cellulophaga baltica]